jgi:P-type Na+/K+ transporter
MASDRKKGLEAPEYPRHPFQLTIDELTNLLKTDTDSGLNPTAAKKALDTYGENKLAGEGGVKWYSVLMKQVSNAMILVSRYILGLHRRH